MSGTQNKRNSGSYAGMHVVMLGSQPSVACAMAVQALIVGESACYFECSPMDHLGTPFGATSSVPFGAALAGVTAGIGNGVLNFSKILMINGYPSAQSDTKNYLYGLNCPIAQMTSASKAHSHFFVGQ